MLFIIKEKISHDQLFELCQAHFKSFIKIVVDIDNKILAAGGELHADGESLMLENGSQQSHLWGANFYPGKTAAKRLEFTALINIRPSDENFGMEVSDMEIREKIDEICQTLLLRNDEVFNITDAHK